MAPIVEVELKSGTYPSCTRSTRVGKCYVCGDMADKVKMVCIGPAVNPEADEEERLHVYRCKGCEVGSDKWMRHFTGKSEVRRLYRFLEGTKMNADLASAVGRRIVENTKEGYEKEICDRLDAKRGTRSDVKTVKADPPASTRRDDVPKERAGSGVVAERPGRKVNGKRSWRTAVVRRSR